MPTDKSMPTVEDDEAAARKLIRSELPQHLDFNTRVANLIVELHAAWHNCSWDVMPPSLRVALSQLMRLWNDLRCVGWLAHTGYGASACILAASIYETAHLIGYIWDNDEPAEEWASMVQPTSQFHSVRALTKGSLRNHGVPEAEIDPQTSCAYGLYQHLCAIKHPRVTLPNIQINTERQGEREISIGYGPRTDQFGLLICAHALRISGSLACDAIKAIIDAHLTGDRTIHFNAQWQKCRSQISQLAGIELARYRPVADSPEQNGN